MTTTVEDTTSALQEATDAAHANREALGRAQTVLEQMEAAADRGEEVDPREFATARADVDLRTRRQTALDRAKTSAQRAHTAAEHAAVIAELTCRTQKLDNIIDGPREALKKAQQAYDSALTKYRKHAAEIMSDAQHAGLPTVDMHGDEDGLLATVKRIPGYPDEFLSTGLGGLVRVGGRVVSTKPGEFERLNRAVSKEATSVR